MFRRLLGHEPSRAVMTEISAPRDPSVCLPHAVREKMTVCEEVGSHHTQTSAGALSLSFTASRIVKINFCCV
jgi:hypothetical protein